MTRTHALDRSRRRGFTLMEILIAIGVIVIGLVGIVAVFPVALRDVQINQDVSIATQVAQSVKSSLRAGFANARFEQTVGNYIVPFVHPGRRPSDLPPPVNPGGSVSDEVLDYLELPPPGREEDPPYVYPSHPARDPLKFYTLQYESEGDRTAAVRSYNQDTRDTAGQDTENSFEALRDPYTQYGFSLSIRPMENRDDLFIVGILICRNPDLYTLIGSREATDEQRIVKEEFFTIYSVN